MGNIANVFIFGKQLSRFENSIIKQEVLKLLQLLLHELILRLCLQGRLRLSAITKRSFRYYYTRILCLVNSLQVMWWRSASRPSLFWVIKLSIRFLIIRYRWQSFNSVYQLICWFYEVLYTSILSQYDCWWSSFPLGQVLFQHRLQELTSLELLLVCFI